MRAAPAADALLADGRGLRWLIVALHVGAMAVLLAWAVQWLLPPPHPVSLAALPAQLWLALSAALLLAGWLGAWQAARLLPAASCRLHWGGQAWALSVDGQVRALARVSVQIDLGRHLLLRLQPLAEPRRALWAVASARAAAHGWHGLRIALNYHAGARPVPISPGGETKPGG